ncbi:MAG TPA: peptide chain release factor N(5)-glutamine methyltransferase [Clostridiales bacterium]|nr:peptide chain release factor N(5)-glutamine methyltransferase [Clostridiales bacterium]
MKEKRKKEKRVSIGGQAVLEGVMMRGARSMATAVRDESGKIRVETKRLKDVNKRCLFLRLPIVRGVVSFISSLFGGTAVLMRSAEVFGEGEPTKFEKWLSEKLKVNVMNVVGAISLVVGLALAIFLFMWLPQTLRGVLESAFNTTFGIWAKNFIEGGVKLLVFILYIVFCSFFKDIKRTFMYHGAEHKTISCYEKGLPLTPENAKTCSRVHDRCGTTFIVFVMVISIIVFACFESLVGVSITGAPRLLCKIALLPLVAGLSYELLKGLSKTTCFVFYPLKLPGLLLQRITTREPDEKMLEVAITAFNKVLEMDADETVPEVKFAVPEKRNVLTKRVSDTLSDNGITEKAESEWIVSIALGIKRDEVYSDDLVSAEKVEKVNEIVAQRITGRPLWYCIGDTDFYGFTIKVDERVLIPRPETEILVDTALKYIDSGKTVLDLCTGSGAVAIAVQKKTGARVSATDVSDKAIELAKENAALNGAKIEFVTGDLFAAVKGRKFDVILTNPPYIKSADIETLQTEVKDFEPKLALDGGEDGLDFYKRIFAEAQNYLNASGVIIAECGAGQAEEIKRIAAGKFLVSAVKDYENIDRIIVAVPNV